MRALRNTLFSTLVLGALTLGASGVANAGPYAPAAGKPGSTAIHKDDASFTNWATGYVNYLPGTGVDATWKTPEKALGQAVGDSYDVVVLGDGGSITLTFGGYITNGAGADFAVFENSFSDTFLELGYVEVSSNGVDFFRFPSASLTTKPVGVIHYAAITPTPAVPEPSQLALFALGLGGLCLARRHARATGSKLAA